MTLADLPIEFSILQGILYLFYPFCGWLADIYICQFKVIKLSFVVALVSSMLLSIASVIATSGVQYLYVHQTITVSGIISLSMMFVGLGMFEANAIQFGMDQMMEASSEQLSSFIHWYVWCAHVATLVMFYLILVSIYFFFNCVFHVEKLTSSFNKALLSYDLLIFSLLFAILSVIVLIFSFCCTRCFHVQQISRNPLKIVFQVLKYSYHHKYPERRSAFTYWENYIPSRIDLGKEKYGGPFTYEQVEDVKTMLRLLLLMVSLFGFHITGDGYSLTNYIMNTMGCPSLVPFIAIIMNPQHIPLLIVTFGIPLYQFFRNCFYRYIPSSLNLMKIGLILALLNESFVCLYSSFIPEREHFECDVNLWHPNVLLKCLLSHVTLRTDNNTCVNLCDSSHAQDSIINFVLVPVILKGLSYLLIFVKMLEFICAQSPNAMKGILIGVWYSMLAIKYFIVDVLDDHFHALSLIPWNIYHAIKGLLILLSVIAFSFVASKYRYRERNETDNNQAIIEEIFERELLFNTDEEDSSYEDN